MSRRNPNEEVQLEVIKDELSSTIDIYKKSKDEENKLKKINTDLNDQIKLYMNQLGVNSFNSGNFTATVTTTQKESLNELRAIEVLKEHFSGRLDLLSQVVKTKEYLDEDALEKLVYNGDFDIQLLASCKETGKPVTTLRISK